MKVACSFDRHKASEHARVFRRHRPGSLADRSYELSDSSLSKCATSGNPVYDAGRGSDGAFRHVVAFDAHLMKIAPHVAAALTDREQEELRVWLEDRRRHKVPAASNGR